MRDHIAAFEYTAISTIARSIIRRKYLKCEVTPQLVLERPGTTMPLSLLLSSLGLEPIKLQLFEPAGPGERSPTKIIQTHPLKLLSPAHQRKLESAATGTGNVGTTTVAVGCIGFEPSWPIPCQDESDSDPRGPTHANWSSCPVIWQAPSCIALADDSSSHGFGRVGLIPSWQATTPQTGGGNGWQNTEKSLPIGTSIYGAFEAGFTSQQVGAHLVQPTPTSPQPNPT